MNIRFYFTLIVTIVLLISCVNALPNLVVDSFKYYPETGKIVARVINNSDENATEVTADFYVDGKFYRSYSPEGLLIMSPGSKVSMSVEFEEDGEEHYFQVFVDPQNLIIESNEEDNSAPLNSIDHTKPLNGGDGSESSGEPDILVSILLIIGLLVVPILVAVVYIIRRVLGSA